MFNNNNTVKAVKIVDKKTSQMVDAHKLTIQGVVPPKQSFLLLNITLNYNRLIVGACVSLVNHVFSTKSGQKTFSMLLMDGKKHSIRLKLLKLPKTKVNIGALETASSAIKSHGSAVVLDRPQLKGLKNFLNNLLIVTKHYDHNVHDYNVVSKLVKALKPISIKSSQELESESAKHSHSSDDDSGDTNIGISTADVNASPRDIDRHIRKIMIDKELPISIIDDANSEQIDHNVVAINLYDSQLKNAVFTSIHNYNVIYDALIRKQKSVTILDTHHRTHSLALKLLHDDEQIVFSVYRERQALKAVSKALSDNHVVHELRLSNYIALDHCLLCMVHLIHLCFKNKPWVQDVGSTYKIIDTPLHHLDSDIVVKKSAPALNNYQQMLKKHNIASVGKNMSKVGSKLIGTLNMSNNQVKHIIKLCCTNCSNIVKALSAHKKTVTVKTFDEKSHRVHVSTLKKIHLDRFIDKNTLSDISSLVNAYKNFHIVVFDNDQITTLCIISDVMTALEYDYGSVKNAQACNMLHYILHSVYNYMFDL